MKVIIVGLSSLGRRLADELSGRRGMSLVLLDADQSVCRAAADRYDALVLHGDGTDPELLDKAGAADADALVTVTGSDAMNAVVALLAKQAGTTKVVAVLNDLALRTAVQTIGVDTVVSPMLAAASEIEGHLLGRGALDFSVPVASGARVAELSPGPHVGKRLTDIRMPKGTLLAMILRERRALVPRGDTTLRQGDVAVVVAEDDKRLAAVRELFSQGEGD
ncbi:MAG: NAD-binding protein [Candidatus Bipolaricaulaceae bacterium]